MKATLSHRKADQQCRECGRYSLGSAPDNCTRCALAKMAERGHGTVSDPGMLFESYGNEMWRTVAQRLRNHQINSVGFHLYVGHFDGGSLEQPPEQLGPVMVANASQAQEVAQALTDRYQQVWVVTAVGAWNAKRSGGN